VDAEIMRSFIAYAQTFNPTIPAELHNYIVARYVEKRKFQREGNQDLSYTYITPRTLLAIIRISQAMAKFHFRDLVEQEDVDQAIKLIDFSFNTLQNMNDERQSKRKFGKFDFEV
jgi:DNA replication licensing factor MCM7